MYKYLTDKFLEDQYIISDEMKSASIFGIGNGYFGQRGSFEEFGDVFVQGTYVRGLFDQIIEIPLTISDNSYMKKYYFDEEKLKEFEYEDSCINIGDLSAFRIYIDGEKFRLWNYKIIFYERYIDFKTGGLNRNVIVEDEKGNRTELNFFKVFSFANDHVFLQTLKIKKLNHDLPITVSSGIDLMCKTNGQHKIENVECFDDPDDPSVKRIRACYGKKYYARGSYRYKNEVKNFKESSFKEPTFGSFQTYDLMGNEGTIKKVVNFYTSIDPKKKRRLAKFDFFKNYAYLYKKHLKFYRKAFLAVNVKISGNKELDTLVRYANYQTLIGFNRHDDIHSLSAKNLTAEKYNQFVWWDCEIYQMPFFLLTFPKETKNLLMYRYNRLKASIENAKKDGYKGAKYAFCSSVNGDEQVWIYAKHPFLQIHIDSDIAYSVLNYYYHTLDKDFLMKYGFKMMEEIILYFISRSTKEGNTYHLKNVTGTDEHHDYVDDDAYTNCTLKFVLKEFIRLKDKFGYKLTSLTEEELKDFNEHLYVPTFIGKILPQFTGYLSLSPTLEVEGKSDSKASSFQMKQSGLYHLSQIIKQPDVLLLYSYLNLGFKENYRENYEYYLAKCEASSSLTYCVHAMAAIDNNDDKTFEENLYASLKIDIDDVQGNAAQGVHAGSLASAYYLLVRGLLGIKEQEDYLEISPRKTNVLKSFKLRFRYQGKLIRAIYRNRSVTFLSKLPFKYRINDGEVGETTKLVIKYDSKNHLYKKEEKI